MLDDLVIDAAIRRLNVRVILTRLSDPGRCDFATRTIEISNMLSPNERRCTIAHECGHFALGLWPTGDPLEDDRIELLCDEWAAVLLIPDVAWEQARAVACDPRMVGEILGVDPATLAARYRLADMDPSRRSWIRAVG